MSWELVFQTPGPTLCTQVRASVPFLLGETVYSGEERMGQLVLDLKGDKAVRTPSEMV